MIRMLVFFLSVSCLVNQSVRQNQFVYVVTSLSPSKEKVFIKKHPIVKDRTSPKHLPSPTPLQRKL